MKILVFFVVGYVLHIFCEKSLLDRPIGGFLRKRRIESGEKIFLPREVTWIIGKFRNLFCFRDTIFEMYKKKD